LRISQFQPSAKSASSVDDDRDSQTYAIIGAAMEVHRILGCGFLEPVYHAALAKEFSLRAIDFRRDVELPITYNGEPLSTKYSRYRSFSAHRRAYNSQYVLRAPSKKSLVRCPTADGYSDPAFCLSRASQSDIKT